MKVLYAATDQIIPGRTGGSVHTLEVARGLAARGHEVHAISKLVPGSKSREERDGFTLHRISWSPAHRFFRFRALGGVLKILDDVRPEVLMERYYNFGGEVIRAAHLRGVPSLLDVNSPAVDTPGSLKSVLDALTKELRNL